MGVEKGCGKWVREKIFHTPATVILVNHECRSLDMTMNKIDRRFFFQKIKINFFHVFFRGKTCGQNLILIFLNFFFENFQDILIC